MSGLEKAALSGELFRARSPSPTRSDSTTSAVNTDDELASDLDEEGVNESSTALVQPANGARTGIKGVMNDKKADDRYRRDAARLKGEELRRGMERAAITIPVSTESDGGGVEEWRRKRMLELEAGRRGLKEVGKEGFVSAVEKRGWVLVLIYEPDIPRCQDLMSSMLELSTTLTAPTTRLDTPITLFRARATTLSFSLLPPSGTERTAARPSADSDTEDGEEEEREADPDVLPTILAYRDGELERKWIRVDWDIGQGSLESLLRSEGILPKEGFDDRVPR